MVLLRTFGNAPNGRAGWGRVWMNLSSVAARRYSSGCEARSSPHRDVVSLHWASFLSFAPLRVGPEAPGEVTPPRDSRFSAPMPPVAVGTWPPLVLGATCEGLGTLPVRMVPPHPRSGWQLLASPHSSLGSPHFPLSLLLFSSDVRRRQRLLWVARVYPGDVLSEV